MPFIFGWLFAVDCQVPWIAPSAALILIYPYFPLGLKKTESDVSGGCIVADSSTAKVTGGVAAVSAAVGAAAQAVGMAAVAHSSGAVIATSAGGYLAVTLGTIGTAALEVVTAPAVAVGGTIAYCHYYDSPVKPRSARQATARKPR